MRSKIKYEINYLILLQFSFQCVPFPQLPSMVCIYDLSAHTYSNCAADLPYRPSAVSIDFSHQPLTKYLLSFRL